MRIVTKAFLRYLPRRRGLSILQLLGIACGVAAAVGMALSARAALTSFSQAVAFLKGKATHSLERPAGPLEETLLAATGNEKCGLHETVAQKCAPRVGGRLR